MTSEFFGRLTRGLAIAILVFLLFSNFVLLILPWFLSGPMVEKIVPLVFVYGWVIIVIGLCLAAMVSAAIAAKLTRLE